MFRSFQRWGRSDLETLDPNKFDFEVRPAFEEQEGDKTFYLWEINPYCQERRDDFPSVAVAIANGLLSGLNVITCVHAFPLDQKRNSSYPLFSAEEELLQAYSRTLSLHRIDSGVYFSYPGDCITQTPGLDAPLSTLVFSGDYGELFTYSAYGFSELSASVDLPQVRAEIDEMPHVLRIGYERSPDLLPIHVDSQWLAPMQCLTIVRNACRELSVSLKIPPELSQYIA